MQKFLGLIVLGLACVIGLSAIGCGDRDKDKTKPIVDKGADKGKPAVADDKSKPAPDDKTKPAPDDKTKPAPDDKTKPGASLRFRSDLAFLPDITELHRNLNGTVSE